MWPFSRKDEDVGTIRNLRADLEDAWEVCSDVRQGRNAAESAMRAMQKAMTDEGVADIARNATAQIADIYAAGGRGVKTRDIQVHAVVARAVRIAAQGEAHWNEGGLAAKAQEVA